MLYVVNLSLNLFVILPFKSIDQYIILLTKMFLTIFLRVLTHYNQTRARTGFHLVLKMGATTVQSGIDFFEKVNFDLNV